jgi:NADPH:quinone reductase-like Zn-dependent oxidoreductase
MIFQAILYPKQRGNALQVGPECSGDWKVGDRVMALCNGGSYAEEVSMGTLIPKTLHLNPWNERL